jgi:hypothetical protein
MEKRIRKKNKPYMPKKRRTYIQHFLSVLLSLLSLRHQWWTSENECLI